MSGAAAVNLTESGPATNERHEPLRSRAVGPDHFH